MTVFKRSFILLIIFISTVAYSQKTVRQYDLGDWISLKNCNYITSVCDGNEYVYFGTNGGVVAYNKHQQYWEEPYTTSDGLADDFIFAVYFDKSTATLWASHRKGISWLTPTAERWTNSSSEEKITRLYESDDELIAETNSGGILTINKFIGSINVKTDGIQTGNRIKYGMTKEDPKIIEGDYFVDDGYQYLLEKVILDPELREYSISLFWIDPNNDIYGGTEGLGLILGNQNVRRFGIQPIGPLQNHVNALAFSDNALWIAGNTKTPNAMNNRTGLSVYDFSNNSWKYYETGLIADLSSDLIYDIQFGQKKIWIGTDYGLSIYDIKRNNWDKLTMSDGLSDQIVWTLAVEDTAVWVGSPLGLSVINQDGTHAREIKLSSFHIKVFKVVTGPKNVWVGTDNGIYSVNRKTREIIHWNRLGTPFDIDAETTMNCTAIAAGSDIIIFRVDNSFMKYDIADETMAINTRMPVIADRTVLDIAIDEHYIWIGTDKGATLVDMKNFYPENYTVRDGLAGQKVFKILPDGDWVWFATDRGLTKYYWRKYAFEY